MNLALSDNYQIKETDKFSFSLKSNPLDSRFHSFKPGHDNFFWHWPDLAQPPITVKMFFNCFISYGKQSLGFLVRGGW